MPKPIVQSACSSFSFSFFPQRKIQVTFPNVLRPWMSLFRRWEDSTRSRQDEKGFLRHDGERQVTICQSSFPHHLFFAVFLVANLVGIMFLQHLVLVASTKNIQEKVGSKEIAFSLFWIVEDKCLLRRQGEPCLEKQGSIRRVCVSHRLASVPE